MHFRCLAFFYGGPDQIMTVTSGLASLVGVLLIFWHKIVSAFFKVVRIFRKSADAAQVPGSQTTPDKTT
jgi:undecaprenyl pyrophosphate phosphatase UppP